MQERKLTIAVSGLPGAGKTTYAKHIAEFFNLRYVSNGLLFRRLAKERGYTFEDFHKLAEEDPNIDKEIDKMAKREALKGGVVVDGHLAVWVLKDIAHIKIIYTAPIDIRAKRVAMRENIPYEKALEGILLREKSNFQRALKYYKINIYDYTVADLVINTGILDIDGVKKITINFLSNYLRLNQDLLPEKQS